MGNIRVNKLALELNVQNDQIIEELNRLDVPVKNHMSTVSEEEANGVRAAFLKKKETKSKKVPGTVKAKTSKTKVSSKTSEKASTKRAGRSATKSAAKKKASAPKTKAEKTPDEKTSKTKATKPTKAKVPAKAEKKITEKPSADKGKAETTDQHKVAKPTAVKSSKPKTAVKSKPQGLSKESKPKVRDQRQAETKTGKKLGLKIIKPEEKIRLEKEKQKATKPEKKQDNKKSVKQEEIVSAKTTTDEKEVMEEEGFETVSIWDGMSVRELAETLKNNPNDIIRELMEFGLMATINQNLDENLAGKVADKLGFEVEVISPKNEQMEMDEEETDLAEDNLLRPPIVTIMGHVDHGKTSLLDAIRETNITESEHGGITQHIGAYQAQIKDNWITFLDTPGHEAFTAMRARGAQVTDIVVLVVAADDGIKPQTKEAIDHARVADVPILAAINKIDKPDAKPDEVKKQLADVGLLPEDWGGQTIFTEVSALKSTGIETLLELLLLQSEVLELRANPKLMAKGVVIESKLDKGRGPVATVLVQKGTMHVGQPFIVGCFFGRVRALINHQGKKITSAGPSVPVEILGMPEVPQPGDSFMIVKDEKKARNLSAYRIQKQRETTLSQSSRVTLEDLHQQIIEGQIKELNIIIKADVQGSIQAVQEAFAKLENQEVRIKIIHDGVGGITESDVLLASASNALIIGFNVRPTEKATPIATHEKVDIRLYSIIYDAINDMKQALDGMLAPKIRERIVGRAEVRQIFNIPKAGSIAGCYVLSGNVERNLSARLIRDNVVVYEGKINSLRRFKDDVKNVPSGYECGLAFEKYHDLKLGDIVEPFLKEEADL